MLIIVAFLDSSDESKCHRDTVRVETWLHALDKPHRAERKRLFRANAASMMPAGLSSKCDQLARDPLASLEQQKEAACLQMGFEQLGLHIPKYIAAKFQPGFRGLTPLERFLEETCGVVKGADDGPAYTEGDVRSISRRASAGSIFKDRS